MAQENPLQQKSNLGHTPLHVAAIANDLPMVMLLIHKNDVDVNAQDKWGKTALHYFTQHKNVFAMKFLLNNGANPNIKDYAGMTPLIYALTPVENFSSSKDQKNDKQILALTNGDGQTILHEFAALNNTPAIKFFADLGVPLDAQDNEGRTALHYCAIKGNNEAIQYLKKMGAKTDIEDHNGLTPELYAIGIQSCIASFNGEDEQIKQLEQALKRSSSIDAQDTDKRTALHHAALSGNHVAYKFLISKNANQTIKDKEGKTAADYYSVTMNKTQPQTDVLGNAKDLANLIKRFGIRSSGFLASARDISGHSASSSVSGFNKRN